MTCLGSLIQPAAGLGFGPSVTHFVTHWATLPQGLADGPSSCPVPSLAALPSPPFISRFPPRPRYPQSFKCFFASSLRHDSYSIRENL